MALWRPPRPTINLRHPASRGLQFSFAAQGSLAAFDLHKRQQGTQTGSPTSVTTARIGQALHFGALTADRFAFPDRPTASSPATIAVIAVLNGVGGSSRTYFQNSTAGGGIDLDNQSAGTVQLVARGVAVLNPTLAVSTAVPYLIVGSMAANNTVNMMTVRLDTGAVSTATSTNASAPTAGNGTFLLGNLDLLAQGADADLAACLFSSTYLSLGTLTEWARDPWGPWRAETVRPEVWSAGSSVSEAIHLADSSTSTGPYPVAVAEAIALSDLPDESSVRASRLAAEALVSFPASVRASRVAVEALVDATGVGEALALADAAFVVSTYDVAVDEALALADAADATADVPEAADEAVALADAPTGTTDVPEDAAEAVALADAATSTGPYHVDAAEALALSDLPDPSEVRASRLAAEVLVGHAPAVRASRLAAEALVDATGVGEVMSPADDPSNTAVLGASADEAVVLIDTPSVAATFDDSVDEAISLVDAPTGTTGVPEDAAEAFSLADGPTATIAHGVAAVEAVGLVDQASCTVVPAQSTGGGDSHRRPRPPPTRVDRPQPPRSGTFSIEVGHRQTILSTRTGRWSVEAGHRQTGDLNLRAPEVRDSQGASTGQFSVETSHEQGFFR